MIVTPLWERWLVVWQLCNTFPSLFSWRGQYAELVNFRVSLEEWFVSCHLRENASYAPNVYACRVAMCAKKYFRSSVPKSDYLKLKNLFNLQREITSCV
uniref:Uncharacterized protein n=1 Tax=Meloidogyne incognita TaxID=6306 RepID=A0A914M5K8_MELIC